MSIKHSALFKINFAFQAGVIAIMGSALSAQVNVGPACPIDGGLRSVANLFDPSISDVFTTGLNRAFSVGDLNGDGVEDLLVADYYEESHFVAVANGATGDFFYTLQSVAPSEYYFAVNAHAIQDVDQDNVPDIVLVSHDGFLDQMEVLVISGHNGDGIARISRDSSTPIQSVYTVTPFSDTNKTGSTDTQDIYFVMNVADSGVLDPATDLNLDGVTDIADVEKGLSQSGPISSTLVSRIATALDGSASGMQFTITAQEGGGLTGWFGFLWTCAGCLINCGESYGAAWDCRDELKEAECDCWNLPLIDISPCLDDLRLNFMSECIAAAAGAAGACGQCILDCHPLAPPTPPTEP